MLIDDRSLVRCVDDVKTSSTPPPRNVTLRNCTLQQHAGNQQNGAAARQRAIISLQNTETHRTDPHFTRYQLGLIKAR
jgi:hypothetical protein